MHKKRNGGAVTGKRNDFTLRNKGLYQRDYENRMRNAEGEAGVYGSMAKSEEEKRKRRYGYAKDLASASLGRRRYGGGV